MEQFYTIYETKDNFGGLVFDLVKGNAVPRVTTLTLTLVIPGKIGDSLPKVKNLSCQPL